MSRFILPFCRVAFAAITILAINSTSRADLIGYWDFNDTSDATKTIDSTQNREGLLESNAAFTVDGGGSSGAAGDYALDLGGPGGHELVRVEGGFLNNIDDTVTFSFWQQLDEISNASSFWGVSPSTGGLERGAQAHVPWSNGQIYFDTVGCCSGEQRVSGTVDDLDFTNWNHFAFVKNGETKEIWVNGVMELSGEGQLPLPTDFTELIIGNSPGLAQSPNGRLDDFAIYDQALSSNSIALLASGESPANVPEPSSLALLLLASLAALKLRSQD